MTKQKLALGSVQLGMNYGIGSQITSLSEVEVEVILKFAREVGIDLIDTASLYGDAEARLSRSNYRTGFSYVTKTIKCDERKVSASYIKEFRSGLNNSIGYLGRVYGVLFHRVSDVLKPGGEQLFSELLKLKKEGKFEKVGFSIYDPRELVQLKKNFDFDLIQLPCNIFDQRAQESDCVQSLARSGVEFHSRSTFLKGAIFLKQEDLPESLKGEFSAFEKLDLYCRETGLTPIELAFSYVKSQKFISRVVIGAQSVEQLRQSVLAYNVSKESDQDFKQLAFSNSDLLNPGNW